jgi:hypothetical protein
MTAVADGHESRNGRITMKKAAKQKLTLDVETLRNLRTLQLQELQQVVGGLTGWISQCCAK